PCTALFRSEVVVELEGEAERVEPVAEVRARRGDAHLDVVRAELHQPSPSASAMDTTSAVTRVGSTSAPSGVRSAHCGSLSPWPVTVTTILAPAGTSPRSARARIPATPAAEAGSANTPTPLARTRCAAGLCPSVTGSTTPPEPAA